MLSSLLCSVRQNLILFADFLLFFISQYYWTCHNTEKWLLLFLLKKTANVHDWMFLIIFINIFFKTILQNIFMVFFLLPALVSLFSSCHLWFATHWHCLPVVLFEKNLVITCIYRITFYFSAIYIYHMCIFLKTLWLCAWFDVRWNEHVWCILINLIFWLLISSCCYVPKLHVNRVCLFSLKGNGEWMKVVTASQKKSWQCYERCVGLDLTFSSWTCVLCTFGG